MRFLVVMNQFPIPARTGSAIVAAEVVRRLARDHHVRLIARHDGPSAEVEAWGVAQVETLGERARLEPLAKLGRAMELGRGIPVQVSSARSPATCDRVGSVLARESFDAVLVFELGAIQFVPRSHWSRVIANIEDPASLKQWRLAALPNVSAVGRVRALLESAASRRYESDTLARLARVLLLSADDASAIVRQHGLVNVMTMRYGVTLPARSELLPHDQRRPGLIVVTGNMFHPPNVDGVLHFLHDVFPTVHRRRPEARLRIVGADPDARIPSAAARFGNRVEITGRVANMSDHLREATVSACPIRLRVGVQTKILESMAWGTPVVSTDVANIGVQGAHGEALLASDDPGEFAEHLVSVLDGDRWERLSRGGRAHVESRFSWDDSVLDLLHSVEEMKKSPGSA